MNFKKLAGLTVTSLALGLVILGDANAAGIRVRCEVGASRSKASVDGSAVTGVFYATVKSGGKTVKSKNLRADPINREVEFDFDSNPRDIAAGATAIPSNFIKNTRVVGSIYRASTGALIASAGADCRAR